SLHSCSPCVFVLSLVIDPPSTAFYTLSLHDALPIFGFGSDEAGQQDRSVETGVVGEVHQSGVFGVVFAVRAGRDRQVRGDAIRETEVPQDQVDDVVAHVNHATAAGGGDVAAPPVGGIGGVQGIAGVDDKRRPDLI